ncbi:MAG: hypothetical protein JJE17_00890 [Peptostreptococcaceae bacterium]|nr:hypothetical protein [Peptostreptococcaceae bacterium]
MRETTNFAVYEHTLIYGEDQLIKRNFIVIKNDKKIIAWTNFHEYIRSAKNSSVRPLTSDNRSRFYGVAQLLNYVFFEKYQISKLDDMDNDMVKSFLKAYGLCKLASDTKYTTRAKRTVDACVDSIIDFLENYVQQNKTSKVNVNGLYKKVEVFSKARKKYITKNVLTFDVRYNSKPKTIFRDIPEKAFEVIMSKIIDKHPNILMLSALSAFAGLRPAEDCNVRRADSSLGAGIRFDFCNGEIRDVFIDLSYERNLRSDLKSVGSIKKERTQRVYPAFLTAFCECYKIYMKFIEGNKYEEEYGALTVNRSGKAYTYDSYYSEFKKVIEECIPEMLDSGDPELAHFGQLLLENSISPHIFRHWFSVKLTLYGEDVAGLMFWRGDKNPDSSLTYIMNKSDLEKQYKIVNNEVFNYSLWKAGKRKND